MKQTAAWLCAALLVLAGFAGAELPATAAPPTAAWSGSAGGATAGVDLSAAALNLAKAQLATSSAVSGSGLTPRSTARSANLDAVAAGVLGLKVLSNTATQGPAAGTSSSSRGIAASVNPLLSIGALQADDAASWAGDAACFTTGPLAQASTRTAGVEVDPLAVVGDPLLSTGASTTTGTTRLVSTGGAGLNRGVESTATGTIADVSVLGLGIGVAGTTTLTTTATGKDGNWSVTVGSDLADGDYTAVASQTDAAGNVSPTDSVDFTVDRPAGPVITSPGNGDVASSPVQICGTGEPGAVVTVTDKDGTELGTATVNGSGSWCITVALPAGGHAVIATQTDQAGNETSSDPVSFVVARAVSGTGGGGTGSTGGGTGSTGGGGTGSTGGGTGSGVGAGSNGGGGLLASTGGPGPAGLGLSALLLVGGAVSVLASRRRRQG